MKNGAATLCQRWSGMTFVSGDSIEQLCECSATNSTSDGAEGYCQVRHYWDPSHFSKHLKCVRNLNDRNGLETA